MKNICSIILIMCAFSIQIFAQSTHQKPRIINTTDLGADPDDIQSMVRFLVQSNEFEVEGLIVATGCWRKSQSNTSMLDDIVDAYALAYSNLSVHSPDFPTVAYLRSISVLGQNGYGMGDVGQGQDSAGSELIIAAVDKPDPRPVWIANWGGGNTLAQALWKVQNTRSQAELNEFISKIRVFDILGQGNAGTWMAKTFPDLIYIRATRVYDWQPSDSWLDNNVQNHGPLGAIYPDRLYATEGDTPAFLHVYPNGLNNPDEPWQGGWGGRMARNKIAGIRGMSCMNGEDAQYDTYYMYGNAASNSEISRWSNGYHNDFQARMDWSITSNYSAANHHPIAIVNGDQTRQVIEIYAAPGSTVNLNAAGSSDPDGNSLSYNWSNYQEAGTYNNSVSISGSTTNAASVIVPSNAINTEIHIILELHDNGSPNLYAYRRVIIRVTDTPPTNPIVNITSPANGASFLVGDTIDIEATATAQEGTISQVEFFVDGNTIGIDTSAPYTSTYTNATGGTHSISAVATDTQSDTGAASVQITVNIPQGPYGGTPATIPGTIEAEHFDVGGNGSAYFDDSAGSETGNAFRNDEDVDIEDCTDTNGGHNIGWWTAGEWLEYTVNVASAGTYNLDLRIACNGDGRTLSIDMGGSQIASNINIPNTGGWQSWQTITLNNIQLNAGEQIMRISVGSVDYINLNNIVFSSVSGNQFPIANAGPDQTLTDSDNNGTEDAILDGTASSDSDGTITSYVWSENGNQIATGPTPSVSLSVGTHNISLTVTDNEGATNTDNVTITVIGEASNDGNIWLEAECGNMGSLWNTNTDSNASGGQYITIQSGNNSTGGPPTDSSGHVSFSFNVSNTGTYMLWTRVITPNANDDSFYLQMDGGAWFQWNQIGPHSSWTWEQPQSYTLNPGNHTLTIAYREDGAQLDKLYITNTSTMPSGQGDTANNCASITIPVTGIAVTPASSSINSGATTQLTASIIPADASNTNVSWTSSNPAVATVNNSGLVTAIAQGNATITATSEDGGFTANANITVSDGTTTSTIRIEESTTGFCEVEGTIDSNHIGFTGIGFANTDNADGNGISWSVNIPGSGTYSLVWKYANEGGSNRNGEVLINGNSVVSNVDFIDTGAWSSWTNSSQISVSLLAGNNTIRLEATSGSGLANIDYIEISGNNPAPSSCISNQASAKSVLTDNSLLLSTPSDFKIHPNPVTNTLIIEVNQKLKTDTTIQLYNTIGNLIISEKFKNKGYSLDMNRLSSGIYILKISNNNKNIIKRIVKK